MSDTPNVTPARPAEPAPGTRAPLADGKASPLADGKASPLADGKASPLADGKASPLAAIDIIAFVCEIFAFGTLALWGFTMWPFPWNIVAGVAAPVIAILLWALFVSPRAVFAVHPFVRAVVELLVYVSATAAWWSMGNAWIGLAFGVVAVTAGLVAGRRRLS